MWYPAGPILFSGIAFCILASWILSGATYDRGAYWKLYGCIAGIPSLIWVVRCWVDRDCKKATKGKQE